MNDSWKTTRRIGLTCPACGSNRLNIPASDDELVSCEDCGAAAQSLGAAKARVARGVVQTPAESRRERHIAEIEASQVKLRKSIANTDRLVADSEKMIRRHHKECDDDVP